MFTYTNAISRPITEEEINMLLEVIEKNKKEAIASAYMPLEQIIYFDNKLYFNPKNEKVIKALRQCEDIRIVELSEETEVKR